MVLLTVRIAAEVLYTAIHLTSIEETRVFTNADRQIYESSHFYVTSFYKSIVIID